MAHSKRNTSLPHFTSYERSLLRSTWGTQRTRLSRESFLPFGSCQLCLQPARAPVVACAANGDLFCRECAISDLLAQRKEIKRLEKLRDEARKRAAEEDALMLEQAKKRELRDFELVSMGIEGAEAKNNKKRKAPTMEDGKSNNDNDKSNYKKEIEAATEAFRQREVRGEDGKRRKVFELGEAEMARYAQSEQERLKKEIEREKSEHKSALPSFWVPSLTPATENDVLSKPVKLTPICPGSTGETRHEYSLKTLVDVHFTEEKLDSPGSSGETTSRVCPSCKKGLTNGLKAMLTKPCGHVICQPCVNKFMTPETTIDPHDKSTRSASTVGRVLCYVCETDITPGSKSKSKSKENGKDKEEKSKIKPGLVEIRSEGTGFARGGDNIAKRKGVAFQC